jgi:hypothetical protein
MSQLPATFKSLFRLFLRTSSASVLHHSAAARSLRALWRPSFDEAAHAIRQLQDGGHDVAKQDRLRAWLHTWNQRSSACLFLVVPTPSCVRLPVDNTLSLLYNSAKSRGLPHRLTRNLSILRLRNADWWEKRHFSPSQPWNPQLPPDSPKYQPQMVQRAKIKNQEEKQRRWRELDDNAWNALGQVVRLAEAKHELCLGTIVPPKSRRFPRRRGRR